MGRCSDTLCSEGGVSVGAAPHVPPPRNATEGELQPAQVQVVLPTGYLCSVVGNGTADPLGEKTFFQQPGGGGGSLWLFLGLRGDGGGMGGPWVMEVSVYKARCHRKQLAEAVAFCSMPRCRPFNEIQCDRFLHVMVCYQSRPSPATGKI